MATTVLCLLFLFLLSSSFISTDSAPANQSQINIWPKPRNFTWPQPKSILLPSDFTIKSPQHQYLTPAVNRYLRQVFTEHYYPIIPPTVDLIPNSTLWTLTIAVADLTAALQDGVSEAYTLVVPDTSGDASLTADTVWGAMRGLESFSQLVWGYPVQAAAGVFVSDSPIFPHRGVMLDTSRNYYPVHDILRTIRAMSANKLNVFHWHITDSHSFPLVLPLEPSLAKKGSYGPGMQYSPADVKRIVVFGMEHGVRILPEIDMPGHAGSWAGAYPEIVSCANMFWWPEGIAWEDRLASEPGTGQLNPIHPKTKEVVKNVIRNVIAMFPEGLYHAGANEVVPGCWKADPLIQNFLETNGTLNEVLQEFLGYTHDYIISLNRTPIYWEDVLLNDKIKGAGLKNNTILQTWKKLNSLQKITSLGYRAIVSLADFYYLDCGHGDFVGNNSIYDQEPGLDIPRTDQVTDDDQDNGTLSRCDPFKTWEIVYNYNITSGLSEDEEKKVIGGEAILWSQQAGPTNLDQRLWPRASAMAESLWSGNRDETGKKRYAEATDRLNEWIRRMIARRVGAEPIQPLWCPRNPGMCNTVHSNSN